MEDEFQDLLQQFNISDPIKDILNHLGYDCTLTFGLAFSSMQMLDQNIQRLLPPGEEDTTSPVCARLRALWSRCNSIHMSPPIPPAQTFPPTPAATPSPSTIHSSSNWRETLPPKLSSDDVTAMKQLFEKNYPGEVLDPHSTPSIRLWSLVHQQKVSKTIKYIPIQLRLSEHQYSAMIETRSSKPLRSEIQLLSQLCWDDTPEMDITSVRFSRDWFNRTSTVLRNAYVLCGMCHLQVFKAFDAKVAEHTFVQLDQELGLRHVVAQEFFSADKKIWGAISNLYSQGSWSFEECLHEMTIVRSDISSLLQPRPRIPKQLPPTRDQKGKGHKGKGGGKGKGGKGKTKSFTFDKKNQCTYGFNDNKKVTLCMKYNAGECKRGDSCPYFHACSARLQSGRPCMQQHAAKDHRGSTWLETDYDTASHLQLPEIATDINPHQYNQVSTSDTTTPPSVPPPITLFTPPEDSSSAPTDVPLQQKINPAITEPISSKPIRLFLDLFAGHSAPLSCAAKTMNIDHFSPFDIEFNATCDILNDDLFENLLKLAHSGLVGAVWSAPPCRFYSTLRKNDGGPPPLRSKEFLDGFPSLSNYQKRQVQESKEIHRRSDLICIAVFQQGGFAGKEQPLNSIAWKEPSSRQFVEQCSCYFVAAPACKWGLDFFKYWAIAATSEDISHLAGQCSHRDHMDFRGKRLPDGSYISALTAEYPSKFASAVIDIISPWVTKSSLMNQDLSTWRSLLSRNPISKGPRITDGAGDASSANWTIPQTKDFLKPLRQMWIKRILTTKLHTKVVDACKNHQSEPFVSEDELLPFLDDIQHSFPSTSLDFTIPDHQPFRLHLLHSLLLISKGPDPKIATLLQEGIPSGAFSQLAPVGLWEPNSIISSDYPDLVVCHDNWTSANHNPDTTRQLIQKELDDGFIEELPDITTAEQRWPKGIALGKLGVVHADNRDPRLVLDSTICGMNGRCHLPEKQRLPNLRHISFFLSSCPPLQDEWQGASIDIKAAHKRMLIREDERGSLLFKFDDRLFAYRSAHFGAKTSAWHWGRVSGAILRLLHSLLFFRHAAWVYVDDFFLLFPKSTSAVQFTLAIILLRVIGAPLSWKKLEFDKTIDWNGWTIHPSTMIAQLPSSKQEKINSLIVAVLQSPSRKNLEKIIGILLWATSLVHHVRFLLTSLYRDLYSIPATNYSINPTEWESFLYLLNDTATITTHNHLHLPVGSRVVEFKHTTISSKSQLPSDIPIERHVWIRIRDPSCEKRRLSDTSKKTLLWSKESLLPLLTSIPLNRSTQMTVTAAADAFATENEMGIGGWIKLETNIFWFSHIWNRHELQPFLEIPKSLQRYISSWEALAQLCILLLVNQKCSTRPGIISIQSGSDNTGAEANINHGFSNTEVLSDIIKLVSIQQIQCNIFLNIHHIPGEKNTDADDLSRGRITNFCQSSRVLIKLVEIFNPLPFPRYINTAVQWDLDLHANAKHFFWGEGILEVFVSSVFFSPFFFSLFPFSLFPFSSFSFDNLQPQPFIGLNPEHVPYHCGQTVS